MVADALSLIDKIDAVPWVEYCSCGRPRSEHKYWVDRIYDYNGYTCPGGVGGEYRYDAVLTKTRHREARAAQLEAALKRSSDPRTQISDLPAHGFGGHAVPGADS